MQGDYTTQLYDDSAFLGTNINQSTPPPPEI